MRIAYTSDLHADLGPRNEALLTHLAARAAALAPDALVVAGDVAEHADTVRRALSRFDGVPGLKLFVPGNHDLYVEGDPALARGETSRDKFERLLPEAAARAGFRTLGTEPVEAGGVTFAGVPGWPDFSLRDPALDHAVHLDHYRAGQWRSLRAFDRGHVLWPSDGGEDAPPGAQPVEPFGRWASDEQLCALWLASLDRQLDAISGAGPVVAVIHVLPFAELVRRGIFGGHPFHDAWLGSARFGERLQRDPRVAAVITGHLHRPADVLVSGRLRVVASPVGNAASSTLPLEELAEQRVGLLEIDPDAVPRAVRTAPAP